jgi:hypothetical protein
VVKPLQCLVEFVAEIGAGALDKEGALITRLPTSRYGGVHVCEPQAMPDAPFGPLRAALL